MRRGVIAALLFLAAPGLAQNLDVTPLAEGSVTRAQGLAAWDRVFEVTSSPRCVNCHVGALEVPMWSGPSYGETRRHGMNVVADESRIGAESIPCRTCHLTVNEGKRGAAHQAPQITEAWRLPPVEIAWFGKSSREVCEQLRDPERNDGLELTEIVDHLATSAFVDWGFHPTGGRLAPPHDLQTHIRDVLEWGAAGMPCAQ